jgi:hypothetical protein
MVSKLKTAFADLLTELGYNFSDNAVYETELPWLKMRTNGHRRQNTFDCRYDIITLTVDVFSAYSGEKEILEIAENIGNHMDDMKNVMSEIMCVEQLSHHILDDNSKGPIKKHGVLSYRFILASANVEEEADENE